MDWMNIAFIIIIIVFIIGGFKRAIELKDKPDEDDENVYAAQPPQPAAAEEETLQPPDGYLIYHGSQLNIPRNDVHEILMKHCPYYEPLLPHLKTKFIIRIMRFMETKIFLLPKETRYREMPVLTSAAAIQLTFGLDHFLLPWYQFIVIHEEEYFAKDSFRILEGNVEGNSITVAWNYLLNGFKNAADGCNVGLHEMAHALWFQHVIAGQGRADKFRLHFDEVMNEGKEIYQSKEKAQPLFSDYAYTNLQELWAESMELFFEKPQEFQAFYPDLFECLKELIQQNPLQPENPVLE